MDETLDKEESLPPAGWKGSDVIRQQVLGNFLSTDDHIWATPGLVGVLLFWKSEKPSLETSFSKLTFL